MDVVMAVVVERQERLAIPLKKLIRSSLKPQMVKKQICLFLITQRQEPVLVVSLKEVTPVPVMQEKPDMLKSLITD